MKRWMILTLSAGLGLASGPAWASDPFPRVADWQGPTEIQSYTPDTLFDAINGAADLYLAYGFKALQMAEYRGEGKASVLVEIYAHGTARQAFGVYSQERVPGAHYFQAGAQAYVDEGTGFSGLVKGSHYVKISGSDLGPGKTQVLMAFALEISRRLPGEVELPALLSAFPGEGKLKNSELYIDQNVLGYPFFKAGFTADYEIDCETFRLFVMDGGDKAGAEAMLKAYLAKLGRKVEDAGPGPMTLEDPNHGPLTLAWHGPYVAGVLNVGDQELGIRHLKGLMANLPR